MRLHGLCGLPRAGTTLLGNLLAQHPDVHVSGTSLLPHLIETVQDACSNDDAIRSDLISLPVAYDRQLDLYRAMCEAWYAHVDRPVVIDKGRGWMMHAAVLAQMYPAARIVSVVRDPRDVIASIIRRDNNTAAFVGPQRNLEPYVSDLMQPTGMVGGPIRFAQDCIQRRAGIDWVRYESFVLDPQTTVNRLADRLDLAPFTFDPTAVENVATDVDGIYFNKFPHDGSGPVKPSSMTWEDVLHPDIATRIAASYPLYMQTFSYPS